MYEVESRTTLKASSSFPSLSSSLLSQQAAKIRRAWGSRTSLEPSSSFPSEELENQELENEKKKSMKIRNHWGGVGLLHIHILEYIHKDFHWLIWKNPLVLVLSAQLIS